MLAALLCCLPALEDASPYVDDPARPNVLFMIADDLNCDLGCYGHEWVQSPNIDRLAATGLRFERAYCQVPLCSPSRTSMLTGLAPGRTGIYRNPGGKRTGDGQYPGGHFRNVVPDVVTLPQRFKDAGYFSARVGKLYHYNVPGGTGTLFDIGTDGLDDPLSWQYVVNPAGRDVAEQHRIFSVTPGQFGGSLSWYASDGTDGEQTDGLAATAAVGLLNRSPAKNRKPDFYDDRPFFLAVGFYRPHTPYVALKSDFEQYPADDTPLPALSEDDRDRKPAEAYRSDKPASRKLSDDQKRQCISAYHASITLMDRQVGRVLDELERLGLDDSTIVIFTSDHGYHMYDHGIWQKQSLFENSARVPLIVRVPKAVRAAAARGESTAALAGLIDLYPTLAELAGLETPNGLDGVSLVPVLDDPEASVRESVLSEAAGKTHGVSVRTDRYRYTEYRRDDGTAAARLLFDYQTDPREMRNLADDPASEDIIAALSKQLPPADATASPERE